MKILHTEEHIIKAIKKYEAGAKVEDIWVMHPISRTYIYR